jgi:hypothetical protein
MVSSCCRRLQIRQINTYMAWITPGIHPRMVNKMLIRKSAPQPRSRKTPRGGRIMAKIILQMSLLTMLVHWTSHRQ